MCMCMCMCMCIHVCVCEDNCNIDVTASILTYVSHHVTSILPSIFLM